MKNLYKKFTDLKDDIGPFREYPEVLPIRMYSNQAGESIIFEMAGMMNDPTFLVFMQFLF